jgi:hypothetical protein
MRAEAGPRFTQMDQVLREAPQALASIRRLTMSRMSLRASAAALLVLSALCLTYAPALAHGHVEVGDYEITIGFYNEPAYQGDVNGIEFGVQNHETGDPIAGLEDSLKLEVIYGASKIELPVRAQFGQEGWYVGYLVPTAEGDYTAHIWGDIEGTEVDVTMTSSPDTFGSIEAKSSIAFPSADPTVGELDAQIGSANEAAALAAQSARTAAQAAQTALIVGIVGALLGAAGIVVGVMGMRARRA